MSLFWWSWLLTVVGVTGFVLAGRKFWWAWYINIACQGLWFAYALVSHQYGFIAASVVYTVVFTQNAVKWTRDHRVLRDACRRFHPDEACIPGRNHPEVPA